MCNMFENYPQPENYIPNNRRIKVPKDVVTIMIGETTEHSFEIPLNLDEDTLDYVAIYKLGLKTVLVKPKEDCKVVLDAKTRTSIMTWTLSPDETKLFQSELQMYKPTIKLKSLLECQVQLKFIMKDNTTQFSDIMNIKLEGSLLDTDTPTPIVSNGFGLTEG